MFVQHLLHNMFLEVRLKFKAYALVVNSSHRQMESPNEHMRITSPIIFESIVYLLCLSRGTDGTLYIKLFILCHYC